MKSKCRKTFLKISEWLLYWLELTVADAVGVFNFLQSEVYQIASLHTVPSETIGLHIHTVLYKIAYWKWP